MKYLPYLLIALVFSIALYYFSPVAVSFDYIFILLMLSFFSIILVLKKKETYPNLKKQYLKHSFLFLLSYSIVHFQYPIDLLLGNGNLNYYRIWINESVIIKSLALTTAGVTSFSLGYFSKNNKIKEAVNITITGTNFFPYISLILLISYIYFAGSSYLSGNYGIVDLSSSANYSALFLKVIVFAYLIQQSRNFKFKNQQFKNFFEYIKTHNLIINSVILIYLFTVMISGDRGPIMYWSLTYYGCYLFTTQNKLSLMKLLICLFLGVIFISTLGQTRSLDRTMSFSERFSNSIHLQNNYESTSFSPKTQELAGSIRTVHMAVNYVPEHHNFLLGRFQYQQISSIIPFTSRITTSIFNDRSKKYGSSSEFLTWVDQGDFAYSGVGTSIVADYYLDFGILGVIIGMFIFGYVVRSSELAIYSSKFPNYLVHTLSIYLIGIIIYIPRSTFFIEIKIALWIYFILKLNQFVMKKLKNS